MVYMLSERDRCVFVRSFICSYYICDFLFEKVDRIDVSHGGKWRNVL